MSLVNTFWAGPPVTRTWAVIVFVISLAIHAQILPGLHVIFDSRYLFKFPPELWRLVTSFCITGHLGIVFDPYLIWTNAGWLEHECPRFSREPGKFFVYLSFVALTTLLINFNLWGAYVFTRPLIIAVVYTWCQQNRGRQASVFFITLDARHIWPAMIFMDFLSADDGVQALLNDLGGVVAAHLYDFLTIYWPEHGSGTNIFFTPTFLKVWFGGVQHAGSTNKPPSGAQESREPRNQATSSGFSSWNARGQGRRLGGD